MTFNTLILHTAALFLLPLQLIFSVFLLLRGHDEPGGGFIAGLVASGAFVLYLFAHGVASTREIMRVEPRDLLALGLLLGLAAMFPGMFHGEAFLTAQWWEFSLGETDIKLSTVLIFDIGVYFAVLGTILTIVMSLTESEE
ncbi:MAG: Na(+)/H(+) antiporter subunit B [Methylophaga sp.]|nr:Na(+)/H(+) antiporter subunit B [Methylophaga sp.]MAY17075.1 Na(+)/H(+) antiporter subunit B [Methylophaga sp.]MBN46136.1 Na(+)/H(+) antiporter subunit B [Methylophaga sp.]HAO26148.1 Na(+)/H(+) antiporter subunit B [Methylophaga sp.]HCD06297.1 Na+/H+ antiporter subunit B [Methylophaga sp.]